MSPLRTILRGIVPALLVLGLPSALAAQESPPPAPQEQGAPPPAAQTGPVQPVPPPPEAAASAEVEGESPLVPEGEAATMASRPVTGPHVYFKPGSGLVVESEDGDFAIATRLRAQLRYTLDHDETNGNNTQAFEVRRARVQFKGHVFGKNNKYKLQLAVSPHDMDVEPGLGPTVTPLLDAYFDFTHLRDLAVRVGQYKVPFSRERMISSGDLEFVDRSLTNKEFNLERDLGFTLHSGNLLGLDMLRYYAGISIGEGRDAHLPGDFDMLYVARVEYLPLGMFEDYEQGDFERLEKPRLSFGLAYAFQDSAKGLKGIGGDTPVDGGTTDYHIATADAVFMYGGLSATLAGYLRYGSRNVPAGVPANPANPRDGVGITGQVGYLIPHMPLQVAARYSAVRGTGATSLPDNNELGAAVGYYFAQHVFKIQADYFHQWLDAFDAGNDTFRLQLQVAL